MTPVTSGAISADALYIVSNNYILCALLVGVVFGSLIAIFLMGGSKL